jgi:hypothetical protein
MRRMPSLLAAITLTNLVVCGSAVAAPTLEAPRSARIGGALTITAYGGLTPRLDYRATFTERVPDRVPGRRCRRDIDQGFSAGTSLTRRYVFHGRVPRTLACYEHGKRFEIKSHPGRYAIVVGHKTGPARWDPDAVTLRRIITIRR